MKPSLLILAAGLGSRYGSLKQIDQFGPCGETIIDYSVFDAIKAGFEKVVFIIRKSIEQEFKEVFVDKFSAKIKIDYVLQEIDIVPPGVAIPAGRQRPWGTGHAVWVAADKINEPFAVINADDFYGATSFKIIFDFLTAPILKSPHCCLVGYKLGNTLSENGAVSRGICETQGNRLKGIVEMTKIYKKTEGIFFADAEGRLTKLPAESVVSMNLMGFTADIFDIFQRHFSAFLQNAGADPTAEFYLPQAVNNMLKAGEIKSTLLHNDEQWFGITYRKDKPLARKRLRRLVAQGKYPDNLWQC